MGHYSGQWDTHYSGTLQCDTLKRKHNTHTGTVTVWDTSRTQDIFKNILHIEI